MNQTVVPIFGVLTKARQECAGSTCNTGPCHAMVPHAAPGQDAAPERAQPGHSRASVSLSAASRSCLTAQPREKAQTVMLHWGLEAAALSRKEEVEGKAGWHGSGSGGTAGSKSRGNAGKTKSKQKPFAMSHLSFVAILNSCNSVKCLQYKSQTELVMFANQVKKFQSVKKRIYNYKLHLLTFLQ